MKQNTTKRTNRFGLRWMTGTALMIAVVLVLGSTPLGRITMPFLTATTLHIPVIIASLVLGWESGMLTGLAFGIHSLISNLSGASFFAPFFINPLVSVLPRVLFPLFVWLIAEGVKRVTARLKDGNYIAYVVASFLGTALHTTMVMGMIYLLNAGKITAMLGNANVPGAIAQRGVGMGIAVLGATNGIPEAIVAAVIAPVIAMALTRALGSRGWTR